MHTARVKITILSILLLLNSPAALASDRPSESPVGSAAPVSLRAGELDELLPNLSDAALRYLKPMRPDAMPERQAPSVYPLHWAALTDQAAVAGQLIDRGTPVDARDGQGRTPLMVAAAFDSVSVAKLLLSRGADPLARDTANGNTPLDFAAAAGKVEVAKLLLVHGVSVRAQAPQRGETPLHYAALYGHLKMIKFLVAEGADINAPDNTGVRPLQYARMRRQWLAVEALLELDARPDDLNDAVNAGDVARIQDLVAHGADVNAPNLFGTPLHLAAATGQTWIAWMLIDAGADLEAEGDPGRAHPLHLAALSNHPATAALLIERGADLDARNVEGRTPLSVAAAYGNVAVAETLLAAGSDPRAPDTVYRDMPIHWAAQSGSVEMVELLLSFGVDINARSGHEGEPPLHYAMCAGNSEMVQFLVDNGADPNMRDNAGVTAVQYALGHDVAKSRDVIALLRRFGARD